MKNHDKPDFIKLLEATMDLFGAKLGEGAVSLWWGAMMPYEFADVRSAFSAHLQDSHASSYRPLPAHIIGRIQARDGWIGAEEAWAIVSQTLNDESVTVFWTRPMQDAFGVAIGLQDDMVAARMAFKEVYTRKLEDARRAGERPCWQISPGTNAAGRDAAVKDAVRLGRILPEHAPALLSNQGEPPTWLVKLLNVQEPALT
jgi:hypothetical protein